MTDINKDELIKQLMNMRIMPTALQFTASFISNEFYYYKNYLSDILFMANSEKEKLSKRVDKILKEDPDDKYDMLDGYQEEFDVYDKKYVEFANNGVLVTVYFFVEHKLKDIANYIDYFIVNKKGSPGKNNKGSYMGKQKKIIEAISGLNFSSLDLIWKEIDNFREIRNLIVHNGANLFEDSSKLLQNQKLYDLVSSYNEIEINSKNGDFYIIDRELIYSFLDKSEEYLLGLIDILKTMDYKDIK